LSSEPASDAFESWASAATHGAPVKIMKATVRNLPARISSSDEWGLEDTGLRTRLERGLAKNYLSIL
jgi:hypothetical protein